MSQFVEIKPEQLETNTFQLIGSDWLLVTAMKDGVCNSMTASWGGLGIMWGKKVAFIFIRPQRYTKEFIDQASHFSLSILDSDKRSIYQYLGTVSGRDENKLEKVDLTVVNDEAAPYFAEANTAMICKKLYAQEMNGESFLEKECLEKWYPAHDYHTMYVVEIEKILVRQ